ncbi:GNAT family N-acetyltransferase [Larkinella sp.]|uniref:GNAT family N-acetyltransferase n=1 Tax=Larkinella sp. TaxID=2034517 RepID=UPI003BAC1D80
MDLFFEYDIERLRRYAGVVENTGKITIESYPAHLLLSFTDVGYFNYCVCHKPAEIVDVVRQANAFYASRSIHHHKLLLDEARSDEGQYQFLLDNGYRLKERLMAVEDPTLQHRPQPIPENFHLERVQVDTLHDFTEDYLAAFESEQKNTAPVITNFRQLLDNENIALFRVKDQVEPVGIAVLYEMDNVFFLAGGAILPAFRNRGYHATALVTRLNWANAQNARRIISWAYDGGASYRNMLKVGLVPYKCYRVYER